MAMDQQDMEKQQHICCDSSGPVVRDSPPPLSRGVPWLVNYHCYDLNVPQLFSCQLPNSPAIQHQHYQCQIPQLRGRNIRGCFHGWVFLSEDPPLDYKWYLWNPATLELINLPPLEWEDRVYNNEGCDDISACCLSAPPSHPDAVVLLARESKYYIAYCLVHNTNTTNNNKTVWREKSLPKHLRKKGFINQLVCTNGHVYAATIYQYVLQVNIQKRHDGNNSIQSFYLKVSLLGLQPFGSYESIVSYMTGYSKELFTVVEGYRDFRGEKLQAIQLFKLNFSTLIWEEMKSSKDHVFLLIYGLPYTQISCPATTAQSHPSGNFIHIIKCLDTFKLYSYNMEEKTISVSSLPCPDLAPGMGRDNHCIVWVMPETSSRLVDDHDTCRTHVNDEPSKEIVVRSGCNGDICNMMIKQLSEGNIIATRGGHLLEIPFHILELIAEHLIPVDYLSFRATCKLCRLAAPIRRCSTAVALDGRSQTHSLLSPWLMVSHRSDQGIFSFIDPKFGDKYFMTTLFLESFADAEFYSSKYGWVLVSTKPEEGFGFFNPFTKSIKQLPDLPGVYSSTNTSFGFSHPPTSPDCIVVGIAPSHGHLFVIAPNKASEWDSIDIVSDTDYPTISAYNSPTFFKHKFYALCVDGELGVLTSNEQGRYSWNILISHSPEDSSSCIQGREICRFLVECDNNLLSVVMDELGEWVQVFKLNQQTQNKWEKVDTLKDYMIFCGMESLSVRAEISGMENKIYFPRFRGANNIVFYSLDTCKFHTFEDKDEGEGFKDLHSTKEQLMCLWIEPSWRN